MEKQGQELTIRYTQAEVAANWISIQGSLDNLRKARPLYNAELLKPEGQGETQMTHKEIHELLSEMDFCEQNWMAILDQLQEAWRTLNTEEPTKPPFIFQP